MENKNDTDFPVNFCPFCGASEHTDKHLTYSKGYDKLTRRTITDAFCNKCRKAFLVVEIDEDSENPSSP